MFVRSCKICILLAVKLGVFNLNGFHMAGVFFNLDGSSTSRIRLREKSSMGGSADRYGGHKRQMKHQKLKSMQVSYF